MLTLLPLPLKDILKHIPTLMLDVIDWKILLKDFSQLAASWSSEKEYQAALLVVNKKITTLAPLQLAKKKNIAPIEPHYSFGTVVLKLYFYQVLKPGPLFLDLNLKNFYRDEDSFIWSPKAFWGEFSEPFQKGLKDIYQGYYLNEDQLFRSGLYTTGLIHQDWKESDITKLEGLFKNHFGGVKQDAISFNLKEFQDSFKNIFHFLMEKKVKLSTDFLLLGVVLTTLYLSMEKIGGEHDVKQAYLQVSKDL